VRSLPFEKNRYGSNSLYALALNLNFFAQNFIFKTVCTIFTMFIPTTAQNLHTKVYTNTASFLLISVFSAIFGEAFDKEKHNICQYYVFLR